MEAGVELGGWDGGGGEGCAEEVGDGEKALACQGKGLEMAGVVEEVGEDGLPELWWKIFPRRTMKMSGKREEGRGKKEVAYVDSTSSGYVVFQKRLFI